MAKKKLSKKEIAESAKEVLVERIEPTRSLSPFDDIERAMEETDRMFDAFFPSAWHRGLARGLPSLWQRSGLMEQLAPKVDVIDRDDEVVVRAEMPGVEKDDLQLSVTENTVTLKGETKKEEKEEKGKYYRCETSRGSFSRTFSLPCEVDGAKAKAVFKDGLLELTLPKVAKAKRHDVKIS
ncbi:Hsp20/alpha crystallin family protein [Kaarinaea lacus]